MKELQIIFMLMAILSQVVVVVLYLFKVVVILDLQAELGQEIITEKFNTIVITYILVAVVVLIPHLSLGITMQIKFMLKVMAHSGLLLIQVQI